MLNRATIFPCAEERQCCSFSQLFLPGTRSQIFQREPCIRRRGLSARISRVCIREPSVSCQPRHECRFKFVEAGRELASRAGDADAVAVCLTTARTSSGFQLLPGYQAKIFPSGPITAVLNECVMRSPS